MKKTNGKMALILALLMICTSILTLHASAAYKNGDKLGDVLNSDIKTYINGERIPCYNIKNKAVVMTADLRNYGFDVNYDNKTRTSAITRNYDKKFTPIPNIQNTTSGKVGTRAFDYVYTDIVAVLDGKKIESFNVQGNLAIFFESLIDYGWFTWDSAARSSHLTLAVTIKGEKHNIESRIIYLGVRGLTNADIEPIKYCKNLESLYLGDNQISDINALKNLTNLTSLNLMENQINDISALSGLTNLTDLYLYSNQISDINALKSLANLTFLDLHDNPITERQIAELQAALPNCRITYY